MSKESNKNNNDDILDIFVQLSELYMDMMETLECHLDSIGGVLQTFSPLEGIINVKVAPEHEAEVAIYVKDLIIKYNEARAELLKSDPFIGIKALLLGEDIN